MKRGSSTVSVEFDESGVPSEYLTARAAVAASPYGVKPMFGSLNRDSMRDWPSTFMGFGGDEDDGRGPPLPTRPPRAASPFSHRPRTREAAREFLSEYSETGPTTSLGIDDYFNALSSTRVGGGVAPVSSLALHSYAGGYRDAERR